VPTNSGAKEILFTTNSKTQKPHTKFHSKDNNRYWVYVYSVLKPL
jgi:hypothetical protein